MALWTRNVCPSEKDLICSLSDLLRDASGIKTVLNVAVSGGSLPVLLLKATDALFSSDPGLTSSPKWRVFYADERIVPLDDPESNHGLCGRTLFSAVYWRGEAFSADTAAGPDEAARLYSELLCSQLPLDPSTGMPRFDLVLLGMGPDGHTASLFPGHELVRSGLPSGDCASRQAPVAAIRDSPKPPSERITLTLPCIAAAERVTVVASGSSKARAAAETFAAAAGDGEEAAVSHPLAALRARAVHWILDKAAASMLDPSA